MAGRKSFVVAHPNGIDTETVLKGGKAPEYATWMFFAPYSHMENGQVVNKPEGWYRVGWSYGDAAKAERTARSTANGFPYKATRVLPAGI